MPTYEVSSRALGPSSERVAFLKKVGVGTFFGLAGACGVAVVSALAVAPAMMRMGFVGPLVGVLGTFLVAHYVCRKMVYGTMKLPGFILAVVCEGISFGFLLDVTVWQLGMREAGGLVGECMGITAATAFGMAAYTWFNRGELSLVRAGLSMLGLPMLILMAFSFVFPVGGPLGILIGAVFVVVSAGGLLYRLNKVTNEMDETQTIEAAYELTMAVLVLLWNIIQLMRRLRR